MTLISKGRNYVAGVRLLRTRFFLVRRFSFTLFFSEVIRTKHERFLSYTGSTSAALTSLFSPHRHHPHNTTPVYHRQGPGRYHFSADLHCLHHNVISTSPSPLHYHHVTITTNGLLVHHSDAPTHFQTIIGLLKFPIMDRKFYRLKLTGRIIPPLSLSLSHGKFWS